MDRQAGVQEGRGNVQVYFTLEYTPAEESAQVTRRPRHASDLDIGGGVGFSGVNPYNVCKEQLPLLGGTRVRADAALALKTGHYHPPSQSPMRPGPLQTPTCLHLH